MANTITESTYKYLPKFIKQESDMEYGSVVTHENYNEKLNLNTTQGDYNTEVLRLLLTIANSDETYHVPYLDQAINTIAASHDASIADINTNVATLTNNLNDLVITTTDNNNNVLALINKIVDGTTKVASAATADTITGVTEAPTHSYYGTDYDGTVGFHKVPDAIFCENIESKEIQVGSIYFKPQVNSVDETMLTENVRTKLNREVITSYDGLADRPSINSKLLTGNVSLEDIGAQPAGSYLTEVPAEYITETELDNYKDTTLASTFITNTAFDEFKEETEASIQDINDNYNRVFIDTVPSTVTPRDGDILVIL